jgi:hypothetical protein
LTGKGQQNHTLLFVAANLSVLEEGLTILEVDTRPTAEGFGRGLFLRHANSGYDKGQSCAA